MEALTSVNDFTARAMLSLPMYPIIELQMLVMVFEDKEVSLARRIASIFGLSGSSMLKE